jgi:hypothetical protein
MFCVVEEAQDQYAQKARSNLIKALQRLLTPFDSRDRAQDMRGVQIRGGAPRRRESDAEHCSALVPNNLRNCYPLSAILL